MGIVFNPADGHVCHTPYAANWPVGTIYWCEDCGKYWRCKLYIGVHEWCRISRMRANRIIAKHAQ